MDDELEMLAAVYPGIVIKTENDDTLTLTLDHHSYNGLRATLHVTLLHKSEYPAQSRPTCLVGKGLSVQDESRVLGKLQQAMEEYSNDLCLLIIFTTFVSFVDCDVSTECGVCLDVAEFALENGTLGDFFVTPQCHHVFHQSCFQFWAVQCKENQASTAESEATRVRRKQIQSMSESELKMAELRVTNIQLDISRNDARRQVLLRKAQDLPSIVKTESRMAERDKEDDELEDLQEVQKRLQLVTKELRMLHNELTAGKKHIRVCETNLQQTVQALLREQQQSDTQQTVPCPVCRTACVM